MAPRFHELPITGVRALTDDAVALRFAVPEALGDAFAFVPGQYVTLRAQVGGEDVRRAYSICTRPDGRAFEVGVKRVAGGALSNHVRTLQPGDTLAVMPPEGRFVARPGEARRVLLIAAGSGITPCLSIATSLLHEDPASHVTLVYGNRDAASIMFRAELDALKDRFTERFVLMHALSRELQDVSFLNGRVSASLVAGLEERGLIDVRASEAIYLCGPESMADEVGRWLVEAGVAPERVHRELFTSAAPRRSAAGTTADATTSTDLSTVRDGTDEGPAKSAAGADVEIVLDGSRRQIKVDGARETVLAAAARQGLELPFSCAGGMCCTCRCRVVAGAVEMDANYSLQAWELEAGFVLACQARPTTDALQLDFDAR